MKRFRFSVGRVFRWQIVLGVAVLLAACWYLNELVQEWRKNKERAQYGGRTTHEWIGLALRDRYWSAHWATLNPPEYANSESEQKVIALGAAAVPELIRRLHRLLRA